MEETHLQITVRVTGGLFARAAGRGDWRRIAQGDDDD